MAKPVRLPKVTSIRLDDDLRNQVETTASMMGMTFSQFTRQALIRNIAVAHDIEKYRNERNKEKTDGEENN